jgi:polyhydroxyalkanoate synthesis regulator phasin
MAEHSPAEGSERVREVIRDGFTIMVGAVWWAFDRSDEWAHTWLHEGRMSRDESLRRFDEFAARTKRAGEDLGRRVSDSMRGARSSVPLATREQVASLERRIEELTRQIESMQASGPSAGVSTPGERSPLS